MKKWIIGAAVIVVALGALGLASRGRGAKAEYRFVEVTRGDLQSSVSSTGTLQAVTTVQVGTQVSGKISDIYADFNDHVTKDQLIARIDPLLLQQAVSSAQADVERSQAELDQAKRDFERISRLYERKVSTETEYNTAEYQYQVAQASLKSSKIGLERARQNLAYTEIRAPIDGIIVDRSVDVGQTVAASFSAPQLFLIAQDLSKMEILAAVDESDIGEIANGQTVDFTVQAYGDQTFSGTVQQIRLKSTSQENVVNYTVVVSVENPDGKLLPGMTATVEFIVSRATDVFKVPNAALRFRPTEEMQKVMHEQWRARHGEGAGAGEGGPGADGGAGPQGAGGQGQGAGMQAPAAGQAQSRPRGGEGHFDDDARASSRKKGGLFSNPSGDRSMLWYLDGGKLKIMPVQTGITDGQATEISGADLKEGMQVIASVASGKTAASPANPFNQQQQRGGPPRFF